MDYESTPDFDANFRKLTSKNKALEVRLLKKIGQILDNPSIGSPSVTRSNMPVVLTSILMSLSIGLGAIEFNSCM